MFLLACCGSTAGMMAFTLQQTVCISTCPPEHEYFPLVSANRAQLGESLKSTTLNTFQLSKAGVFTWVGLDLVCFSWLRRHF